MTTKKSSNLSKAQNLATVDTFDAVSPRPAHLFSEELYKYVNGESESPYKRSGGVGLVQDYLSFRNTYWGQAQPVDFRLLWKAYLEDPFVLACVNITTNYIVGDGWELRGGSKLHRKKINDIFEKNNWNSVLGDLVRSLIIYGNAYLELVRGERGKDADYEAVMENSTDLKFAAESLNKKLDLILKGKMNVKEKFVHEVPEKWEGNPAEVKIIGVQSKKSYTYAEYTKAFDSEAKKSSNLIEEFYVRDSTGIRIDYNEHATVIKYIQRVLHRRVDFYPDEMIHFKLNIIGGRAYGSSWVQSVLRNLNTKFQGEQYNGDWFRRGAIPRTVWKLPKQYSKEQVARFGEGLKNIKYQQDIIISGEDAEVTMLSSKNQEMQFKELLDYLNQNIMTAAQVPPVVLGITATANKSSSSTQLEGFYRYISTLKSQIANIINSVLITDDNFGFDDVTFVFKDTNAKDLLKQTQAAQLMMPMIQAGIVTRNDLRQVMGMALLEEAKSGSTNELGIDNDEQVSEPVDPMAMMGMNPAGGIMQQRGGGDPRSSPDKADNRESQNTDQQKDTIGPKKEELKPMPQNQQKVKKSLDLQNTEYIKTTIQEVLSAVNKDHKVAYESAATVNVPFASGSALDPKEKADRKREVRETHARYEKEDNQNDAGKNRDYSFGAVAPWHEGEAVGDYFEQVRRVQRNGVDNAFSLNEDRHFPDAERETPKNPIVEGETQLPKKSKKKTPKEVDPERDEVNEAGKKVWAASDKAVSTAVFYKGIDQLEEMADDSIRDVEKA